MEQACCAEHQSPATTTCPRCGAFLCPKCTWQSSCAACYRRGIPAETGAWRAQEYARASWGAFLVSLGALFLSRASGLISLVAPVLWLAGIGAGIGALWLRRGAPGVLVPALVGIALNSAPIVLLLMLGNGTLHR